MLNHEPQFALHFLTVLLDGLAGLSGGLLSERWLFEVLFVFVTQKEKAAYSAALDCGGRI